MRGGWLALVLLAGCDRVLHLSEAPFEDAPPLDAALDGPPDAACIPVKGSAGVPDFCLTEAMTMEPLPPDIDTGALDSEEMGTCSLVLGAATEQICVITTASVMITSNLAPRGGRPLAIVASTTITVAAGVTLDLSGALPMPAAGRNDPRCMSSNGSEGSGGRGGGGGGFAADGGTGGQARGIPDPVLGGVALTPIALRGGCLGGKGGNRGGTDTAIVYGGAGGNSGGSILLMAGVSITIAGNVVASGAPGKGGDVIQAPREAGGGGGGSGGMIALVAPTVTVVEGANIVAIGGGGGGGGGANAQMPNTATQGQDGSLPMLEGSDWISRGGPKGAMNGGFGGDGGYHLRPAGLNGTTTNQEFAGSGGGGGGVGYIFIDSDALPAATALIQPTPQRWDD